MDVQPPISEAGEQQLAAWILPISPTQSVAVGQYELKHLEHINSLVTLPGLPAFCERGFVWHNRFIPAVDLRSLVTRKRMTPTAQEHLAAIIAYESAEGEIAMGALLLAGMPKLISVSPSQSVEVTELQQEWQLLAQAAFSNATNIFPVLNLRCLFDKTPADLLSLH